MNTQAKGSAAGASRAERRPHVDADDGRAVGQSELAQVACEHRQGAAVALDEDRAGRAARERLDAQRAGAGVEVQHRAGGGGPRMLKSASRTREAVGRVPLLRGVRIFLPRSVPPVTRISWAP